MNLANSQIGWMLRTTGRLIVLVCLAAAAIALTPVSVSAQAAVLDCGAVINTRAGTVEPSTRILVQDGRIKSVGRFDPPADATVVDLTDRTCLPGLIDSHTHLLTEYRPGFDDDINGLLELGVHSDAYRALRGAVLARQMLQAGFVAVRDLGNAGAGADLALRDAIAEGWATGPRMLVATRALAAVAAQAQAAPQPIAAPFVSAEYRIITGAAEARRAVREAVFEGADVIKVIVGGGPSLTTEELGAIVEEAHRLDRRVAAHAAGDAAARAAVLAGVDSIEHGYELSDQTLRLMAQRRVWLTPTDLPAAHYLGLSESPSAARVEAVTQRVRRRADRLARAAALGVRIALGSDGYYRAPSRSRGRVSLGATQAYADAGLTPMQVIKAATLDAAELLGLAAELGAVEPGLQASIIATVGNPASDIAALGDVRFVMKEGAVVRDVDRRAQSGSSEGRSQ